VDWYQIELGRKTFARIEADQREIDVGLQASNADGSAAGEMDSGPFGRETISLVAGEGGIYRIGVRAAKDTSVRGSYQIRVSEQRPVRADDLKRISAQATFARAQKAGTADSIPLYQTAARLWKEAGDSWGEEAATDHLGIAYGREGRWQDSYQSFVRALQLAGALKDEYGRLEALQQIGRVAGPLGEHFSFVPSDAEFLRLWERTGDRRGIARALANLSDFFREHEHDYSKAREYANKGVALQRALGDPHREAKALESLVSATMASQQFEPALKLGLQVLRLNQSVGDQRGEAAALDQIGLVLERTHQYREAASYFQKEISLREAQGDRAALDVLQDRLAQITLTLGEPLKALSHAQSALALEESIRADIPKQKWRYGFAGTREITGVYVRTLLALDRKNPDKGYGAEAFMAADRAHGRILFDHAEQLRGLSLSDIQKKLLDKNTALLEYSLGREDQDRQESYLWLVTPKSFGVYQLPPRSAIERLVHGAYDALSRPTQASATALEALSEVLLGPVATDLHAQRLLIVPDGLLQYVPFSALREPGSGEAAPLAMRHTIEYIPSGLATLVLQESRAPRQYGFHSIALVADPVFDRDDPRLKTVSRTGFETVSLVPTDFTRAIRAAGFATDTIPRLSYSRLEARWALQSASLERRAAFLDFSATRDLVSGGRLRGYDIVHFATHGLLNDDDPDLSGLLLSRVDQKGDALDGFLRVSDLYAHRLPAQLVVLSACQTALGKLIRGEGMLSLTTGFLHAGAGSVLSTAWKVNDEATAEFMKAFYTQLLGSHHRSPVEALRAAQLEFYQSERWHLPYYWAGFVLSGVEI